jgi:hypothetical protein
VSIGQNVFSNKLLQGLAKYAPSIDPSIILKIGATSIQSTVDKSVLPGVTLAYNDALTHSFLVAAVMAAFTIVGSAAIEWTPVKAKKIEMSAAWPPNLILKSCYTRFRCIGTAYTRRFKRSFMGITF